MEKHNPFIRTIYEARTLFKTEFEALEDSSKDKETLTRLKLNHDHQKTIQKMKFDHEQLIFNQQPQSKEQKEGEKQK